MATLIHNVTAYPVTLPGPYSSMLLAPGQGVVVQDSLQNVINNLGGAQALSSIFELRDVGTGGATGNQAFDPTPRKSLTENTTLKVGDNGRCFDNAGATSQVIATLPPSASLAPNWKTHWRVAALQLFQVLAQGTDVFRFDGTPAASQFWQSQNLDSAMTVEYQGQQGGVGVFLITSHEGEWADA